MNERDFQIGDREFKLNKIDAFKQFHIVRRIAPILGEIIPVATKIASITKSKGASDSFDDIAPLLAPIMNGFAKLSDEDANRVLLGLLSSVEMKQASGNWARVANDTMMMFADIEMPVMLQAAGRAFMYNMSGFFQALPQVSHGAGSVQSVR